MRLLTRLLKDVVKLLGEAKLLTRLVKQSVVNSPCEGVLLTHLLKGVVNSPSEGVVNSPHKGSDGDFSVKSVRNLLDDSLLTSNWSPTRWVKEIPIKINIFAWRVQTDSLPTRLNLSRRGIDIHSITCPNCDLGVESMSHLLFSCSMARDILAKMRRWWDIPFLDFQSHDD
ncbi:RNA-directed DNA polymerase, eukaryota [Tanacetum coccineum]